MAGTPDGARKGRIEGNQFQNIFERMAKLNGLYAERNHLTAKFTYSGRTRVMKSELDYKLINREGRLGFFDCKSFEGSQFNYSMIEEHQVRRAAFYNQWRIPSGFVVWFRTPNRVVFYSGMQIFLKGAGNSFTPDEGTQLGQYHNFDIKKLLGA